MERVEDTAEGRVVARGRGAAARAAIDGQCASMIMDLAGRSIIPVPECLAVHLPKRGWTGQAVSVRGLPVSSGPPCRAWTRASDSAPNRDAPGTADDGEARPDLDGSGGERP